MSLNISTEEEATGTTAVEKEKVFYARIESMEPLSNYAATSELQEQWQLRIPKTDNNLSEGRIRVRATTTVSGIQYVQTIKIPTTNGQDETSFEVTQSVFEQFKKLSNDGMIKRRYFIPIEGREEKWEVDVFNLPNGKTANWVKIDFEFKSETIVEPPRVPEFFIDVIPGSTQDPEEREFISTLYSDVFTAKPKAE